MTELMEQVVSALTPLFAEIHAKFDAMSSRFEETNAAIRRIAVGLAKTQGDVAEMKETMATRSQMSARFDLVEARFDAILPVLINAQNAQRLADQSYVQHRDRLDDHERRLRSLEKRPPGSA